MSDAERTGAQAPANQDEPPPANQKKPRKPRAPRPYCPKHRSGGWAILVALRQAEIEGWNGDPRGMRKDEVVDRAREHCESSFDSVRGEGIMAW